MVHKISVFVVDGVIYKIYQDRKTPTRAKPGMHVIVHPGDTVRWHSDSQNRGMLSIHFVGDVPFAPPLPQLTAEPGKFTPKATVIGATKTLLLTKQAQEKIAAATLASGKRPHKVSVPYAYTITVGDVTTDPDIIIDMNCNQ